MPYHSIINVNIYECIKELKNTTTYNSTKQDLFET